MFHCSLPLRPRCVPDPPPPPKPHRKVWRDVLCCHFCNRCQIKIIKILSKGWQCADCAHFIFLSFAAENTKSSGRNIPWRSFCRFSLLWMRSSQRISFISLNCNISPKDGHKIYLKYGTAWTPAIWQCYKTFSPKSVARSGDIKCPTVPITH
jgi:hypothetical protein